MRKITLLSCWALCQCLAGSVFAGAEGLDAPTYQLWQRHWRVFAMRCARYEDRFLVSPEYDRRYPSSAGVSVRQARADLAEEVQIHTANMVRTKTIQMPLGEAQAIAMPIPSLNVGMYGYLESVEVEQVLGPTSALVSDVRLIDERRLKADYKADRNRARRSDDDRAVDLVEHMYSQREALADRQDDKSFKRAVLRLEGFPTRGMTERQRWAGPQGEGFQVVIARQELYGSERRPKLRLVAVNLKQIDWGLDEDAFIQLLAARGMAPRGFVQRVLDEMSEHDPDTARQRLFVTLLPDTPDPDAAPEQDTPPQTSEETETDAS